jgi:myosin-crossreactive antigen
VLSLEIKDDKRSDEKCEDSELNESQTKVSEFKINRLKESLEENLTVDALCLVKAGLIADESSQGDYDEDHSTADESSVVDGRSTCKSCEEVCKACEICEELREISENDELNCG